MPASEFCSHKIFLSALVTVIAAYFIYATLLAIANPLCCADDASFAVVSKNIAHGLGYAMTLNYRGPDYALHLFDPALGTGPTLIFAAAILIKLFGAVPWAPGEATVILCTAYLSGIGLQLKPIFGRPRSIAILLAFIIVALLSTAYDFHYWSAQLGEAPATLAIILGYLFWANRSLGSWNACFAGLLLALSFLTKELSAIYVAGLAAFASIQVMHARYTHRQSRTELGHYLGLLIGLALPVLCFEFYRLYSLGSVHAYFVNWSDHLAFVSSQGHETNGGTWPVQLSERSKLLADRFAIYPTALTAGIAAIVWGILRGPAHEREAVFVLATGAILHAVYWYFLSNGWSRYAVNFLLIWLFLLACLMSLRHVRGIVATVVLLSVAAMSLPRLPYLESHLFQGLRNTNGALSNEESILTYLRTQQIPLPIYTGWWAQVASLEYMSTATGVFNGYQLSYKSLSKIYYVLINSAFPANSESLTNTLSHCDIAHQAGQYTLYECRRPDPEKPQPLLQETAAPTGHVIAPSSCNIESFNGVSGDQRWALSKSHNFIISGWMIDTQKHVVPSKAQLVLENTSLHLSWSVPISQWQRRVDVATSKHENAYLDSGFTIYVSTAPLPSGHYKMTLRNLSGNPPSECDNGRSLLLM